jgi:hypothetical protein
MQRCLKYAIIALGLAIVVPGMAQTEGDPTGEFIYKGRHYVPHRPWLIFGMGYGYSTSEQSFEPNLMLDYHFRVQQKHYLGIGFVTSRSQFFDSNSDAILLPHQYVEHSVNSLHALYGWRHDGLFNHVAFFAGPALNWGYQSAYTDSLGRHYVYPYTGAGVYASLQYSRKLFYDIGIGASLFGSINRSYQVFGLTLHVYLSSAFKRNIN